MKKLQKSSFNKLLRGLIKYSLLIKHFKKLSEIYSTMCLNLKLSCHFNLNLINQ